MRQNGGFHFSPTAWLGAVSPAAPHKCSTVQPGHVQTPQDAREPHPSVCCGVATGGCGQREFLGCVVESPDPGGAGMGGASPLALQPTPAWGCYLNQQQKCQCICDIFLKMAEETRS